MRARLTRGFTIIELLVVVSVIGLLVGILMPAITKARDQSKLTASFSNLRNIGTAHKTYAAEFADRQWTLVNDNISSYAAGVIAFDKYYLANGGEVEGNAHPGPILGWGYLHRRDRYVLFIYRTHERNAEEKHDGSFNSANASLNLPIAFSSPLQHFGAFRLMNMQQFSQYLDGRFYSKTLYAPKDLASIRAITGDGEEGHDCFEDPAQFCDRSVKGGSDTPVWTSYCTSPAAMYAPSVMAHDDPEDPSHNGWVDPWSLAAGHRSPTFSQALFPSLKTHVLEHHWLQNSRAACNPGLNTPGNINCEPYFFNHGSESNPATLFYDGHIETVGVRQAMRADGRMRMQTRVENWGLWSRDTEFGAEGYLIDYGYDQADTSFHILTTDGIRGRDVSAN